MKIGPFVKCPHPEMIEAIALSGCDFAVLDMEHTPLGPRDLYPLALAAECRGLGLAIRIPRRSEEYVKWCLDLGVREIQIPHITTPDDVRDAMRMAYFSPLGERGLCRFVRAAQFSALDKGIYLREANQLTRLVLQLEGAEAIECLPEILEGIESNRTPRPSIFIGPYDLSQSLGVPGEIWHSAVLTAMRVAIQRCHDRNFTVGTFTDTPEGVHYWREQGVDFLEYGSDLQLFIGAARELKALVAGSEA